MKVKTRFKNMDIFERAGAYLRPRSDRQLLVFLLPLALLFMGWPQNLSARQDGQDPAQASQGQQYIQQTPEQLQQLVAPNSEALRLITTLFLLRVHFTVRIHFPIQMPLQPSRSQRSNQMESATPPRRCAHGLLALQRLR
jgi:hypothetical protein